MAVKTLDSIVCRVTFGRSGVESTVDLSISTRTQTIKNKEATLSKDLTRKVRHEFGSSDATDHGDEEVKVNEG